jgi:hypothetical protein
MRGPSFRLSVPRVLPGRGWSKRLPPLALAAAVAGCGGGGAHQAQVLNGNGFSFSAPGGWSVKRTPQAVAAASGDLAVSVTVFRLERRYRPALWPKVLPELDAVAKNLAGQLEGSASAGSTVTVAGRRARRYDIGFARNGRQLVERITFLLDGRREFQLLCRYRAGADEPACAALGSSFRLR